MATRANPEHGLDQKLARTGEQQLDELVQSISTEDLLGSYALQGGLMDSLRLGNGNNFRDIDRYRPGVDRPLSIITNTLGQGDGSQVMCKKNQTLSSPQNLHVLIDAPQRHEALGGDYSATSLSRYVLSLTTMVSSVANTPMDVYLRDKDDVAGLLMEDEADDMYIAYRQLDGVQDGRRLEYTDSDLKSQLEHLRSRLDEADGVAVIFSDFLDGYDVEKQTFAWQKPLQHIHDDIGDRLWAVRLTSPAQSQYPLSRVNAAMDMDTIDAINRRFATVYAQQQEALYEALSPLELQTHTRLTTVDTHRQNNEQHPTTILKDAILGREVE